MELIEAPLQKELRIKGFGPMPKEKLESLEQLGFEAGAIVKKLYLAPLGDPCAFQLSDSVVALHKKDYQLIFVEIV
jgi:Fe2+ transport system protein FeoA